MKEKTEYAAGGIVGRGGKVLLVQVRNLEGEIVWTFPKGHLEKKETWLSAALREVEEETGWRCRNRGLLSNVTYRFERDGKPVFKRVRWYKMEPLEKTGEPDSDEIRRVKWVEARDAAQALSYPSEGRVLALYLKGPGWRMKPYFGECRCGNIRIMFQTSVVPAEIKIRKCQCDFCIEHSASTATDVAGLVSIEVKNRLKANRTNFSYSALQNAAFFICKGCETYIGAILDYEGKQYSTINLRLFPDFKAHVKNAEPVDYARESKTEKLKRRLSCWTPTSVRFVH